MFPAFLTTLLFSISATSASRSVSHLGSNLANVCRLAVATVILGCIALAIGVWANSTIFWIFFFSGVVGFGIGDVGLFYAFPRIGARLCVLYSQCVAAPIAGIIEWLWLGTSLSVMQVVWAVCILIGVAVALDIRSAQHFRKSQWLSGTLFGLIAAFGQGAGAVISRYGYDKVTEQGETLPPLTAAFFRVIGGLIVGVLALWMLRGKRTSASTKKSFFTKTVLFFVVLNALTGPVLGVTCYQWALEVRPSFVVLPIIALTPITVIPLSMLLENDRPSLISIVGAVIAVISAILLSLATL